MFLRGSGASCDHAQFAREITELREKLNKLELPKEARAEVEREARRFGDSLSLAVDWDAVGRLDAEMLVNAIAQVAPFDIGAKQALLEAESLVEGDRTIDIRHGEDAADVVDRRVADVRQRRGGDHRADAVAREQFE